jgi:glycosyltransferase involved in cell wall biosynthesis
METEHPHLTVVIESSTWHGEGHFGLGELLAALCQQSYPRDRLQVIVVIGPGEKPRWSPLRAQFPDIQVIELDQALNYYQARHQGVLAASGEIVACLDADNWVGENWSYEITRPFLEHPEILAVHGRSRFREAFLSRMWDAIWWERAYEPEGPIDRIFAANNLALRSEFARRAFYPDPRPFRSVWERVMTERIREAGGIIWLNPRPMWRHDFNATMREFVLRALSRGSQFIAARASAPRPGEELQRRFIWLLPWVGFPFLVLRDMRRIIVRTPRTGLSGLQLLRIPIYLVALLPVEVVIWIGMLMGAYFGKVLPPP